MQVCIIAVLFNTTYQSLLSLSALSHAPICMRKIMLTAVATQQRLE